MKHMVLVASLLALVGWSVAADDYNVGYYGVGFWGSGRGSRVERGLESAGATEAQVAQVMNILEEIADDQDDRRDRLRDIAAEIRDEVGADNPNRAQLGRLVNEAATLQGEIRLAALNSSLDIREIVGDDVWEQLHRRNRNYDDDDDDDDYNRRWWGRRR